MSSTIFCIDFDETLLNTDRLKVDLIQEVHDLGGEALEMAYVEAYEAIRKVHGVVRIPLVLKNLSERADVSSTIHRQLAENIHGLKYQEYLYPGAEQAINFLKERGKVLILSDGDSFFQPQKIYATSVASLVDAVIIPASKIDHFADLEGYWPADHYVFIDDKQKVLDAAKQYFSGRATTVWVRQGRYADQSVPSAADIGVDFMAQIPEALAQLPQQM